MLGDCEEAGLTRQSFTADGWLHTGANLAQPLVIVMLNVEAIAKAHDPAGRSEIEASLGAHLAAVNATLDAHERLASLVIVSEPWTIESGFITPTFKVRRNRVEEVYAARYERWSESRQPVIWVQG